jgi:hypothetical protein
MAQGGRGPRAGAEVRSASTGRGPWAGAEVRTRQALKLRRPGGGLDGTGRRRRGGGGGRLGSMTFAFAQ